MSEDMPDGFEERVREIVREELMRMRAPDHPMQEIYRDTDGVIRFRSNSIVRFLLDTGGHTLNTLSMCVFPREDWEQFYQLIGYSLCGYSELSNVSDESNYIAQELADEKFPTDTPPSSA